jgi:hypothetical protein
MKIPTRRWAIGGAAATVAAVAVLDAGSGCGGTRAASAGAAGDQPAGSGTGGTAGGSSGAAGVDSSAGSGGTAGGAAAGGGSSGAPDTGPPPDAGATQGPVHAKWIKRMNARAYSLAVTDDGDLLAAGTFTKGLDLGGAKLQSQGFRDAFVAKLKPIGTHVWSHNYGGTGDETVKLVAPIAGGGLIASGVLDHTEGEARAPCGADGKARPYAFIDRMSDDGTCEWDLPMVPRELHALDTTYIEFSATRSGMAGVSVLAPYSIPAFGLSIPDGTDWLAVLVDANKNLVKATSRIHKPGWPLGLVLPAILGDRLVFFLGELFTPGGDSLSVSLPRPFGESLGEDLDHVIQGPAVVSGSTSGVQDVLVAYRFVDPASGTPKRCGTVVTHMSSPAGGWDWKHEYEDVCPPGFPATTGATVAAVDPPPQHGPPRRFIVGGCFRGSIDFGLGKLNAVGGPGDVDAFLASFTPAGQLEWVRTMGGQYVDSVLAVAVSKDGTIFVSAHGVVDPAGEDAADEVQARMRTIFRMEDVSQ